MNRHNNLERLRTRSSDRSKPLRGLRLVGYLMLVLLAWVAQFSQAATFPRYDLAVKRITVAGLDFPIPAGDNTISVGIPGRIEIEYAMQFKEGEDSLVSPDAVILHGDWYPVVKGMQVYHLTATLS